MEFKYRLKELRTARGLSQKELGEKIGTTYSAISFWENGVNEPKLSYIIALCKFFEVSSDYLLGLED
ncbi:MAG: helix-turn-helix transcriptional regulator [Clostridia bacterium]|nr:helix-turn-helix transcriptional regulator [Clostridia bacterium]